MMYLAIMADQLPRQVPLSEVKKAVDDCCPFVRAANGTYVNVFYVKCFMPVEESQ